MNDQKSRCGWVGDDPLYRAYHDTEWGVPVRDDRVLFEFLILEGAQAGLSWITILKRREGYRRAFDGFDPEKIARYDERKKAELLQDVGIIRNRQKIEATVTNARLVLELQGKRRSFAEFLWQFVDGRPRRNSWKTTADIPARTPESEAMSKELMKRGFRFVGPTICYAHMQATGLVNDHLVNCFRYREV
ncbi:MAG: DNA-3-methyladenine glycosylase I [SAR324 cluster bacterium]|nr:DNA-3-methyladenine glycosylase I [SAR324 cluster bacterium]